MVQYSSCSKIIRLHISPAEQCVLGTRHNAFYRRDKLDFWEARYSSWRRRAPRKPNVSEHMLWNTFHSFLTRTHTRDSLYANFLVPCTASNCKMTGNDGMVGPKKNHENSQARRTGLLSVLIQNLPQKEATFGNFVRVTAGARTHRRLTSSTLEQGRMVSCLDGFHSD